MDLTGLKKGWEGKREVLTKPTAQRNIRYFIFRIQRSRGKELTSDTRMSGFRPARFQCIFAMCSPQNYVTGENTRPAPWFGVHVKLHIYSASHLLLITLSSVLW
jgi:hypothetical protein